MRRCHNLLRINLNYMKLNSYASVIQNETIKKPKNNNPVTHFLRNKMESICISGFQKKFGFVSLFPLQQCSL